MGLSAQIWVLTWSICRLQSLHRILQRFRGAASGVGFDRSSWPEGQLQGLLQGHLKGYRLLSGFLTSAGVTRVTLERQGTLHCREWKFRRANEVVGVAVETTSSAVAIVVVDVAVAIVVVVVVLVVVVV